MFQLSDTEARYKGAVSLRLTIGPGGPIQKLERENCQGEKSDGQGGTRGHVIVLGVGTGARTGNGDRGSAVSVLFKTSQKKPAKDGKKRRENSGRRLKKNGDEVGQSHHSSAYFYFIGRREKEVLGFRGGGGGKR